MYSGTVRRVLPPREAWCFGASDINSWILPCRTTLLSSSNDKVAASLGTIALAMQENPAVPAQLCYVVLPGREHWDLRS